MSRKSKILGCLGAFGLVVAGLATMVAVNWDATREALDTREKQTQATLFRLGELASIDAELKAEYGTKPKLSYDTDTGVRVLSIAFGDYLLPEGVAEEDHAREIAGFAAGKTRKLDQIDSISVSFRGSGPYSFSPDELMTAPPQDDPVATMSL